MFLCELGQQAHERINTDIANAGMLNKRHSNKKKVIPPGSLLPLLVSGSARERSKGHHEIATILHIHPSHSPRYVIHMLGHRVFVFYRFHR